MKLKQLLGSLLLVAPLGFAAPAFAQTMGPAGMTPSVGGSGTVGNRHVSGFQTGPGLQPPMAAPTPQHTAPVKAPPLPAATATPVPSATPAAPSAPPTPRANPEAPRVTPGPAAPPTPRPKRNDTGEVAAPPGPHGVVPEPPQPKGINPERGPMTH